MFCCRHVKYQYVKALKPPKFHTYQTKLLVTFRVSVFKVVLFNPGNEIH